MPTHSFAVEAQAASVDTLYSLTGDFAGGTHATVVVPNGCSKIYHINATVGFGATAGAGTAGIRISGSGVAKEQNLVMVGCLGVGTSVTSLACNSGKDVDIAVIPGGALVLEGWVGGSDTGTPELGFSIEVK